MVRTPNERLEVTHYMAHGQVIQDHPWKPNPVDYKYMDMALAEARMGLEEGNPPVGALIVANYRKQTLTFPGHSTEYTDEDLDHHAEFNAYQLCKGILGRDLSKASAYITAEPCDGCANRFVQGRIGSLIIAAKYEDAPYFRPKALRLDHKLRDSGRNILVVRGLRKVQALELLAEAEKRGL